MVFLTITFGETSLKQQSEPLSVLPLYFANHYDLEGGELENMENKEIQKVH